MIDISSTLSPREPVKGLLKASPRSRGRVFLLDEWDKYAEKLKEVSLERVLL